MYWELCEEPAYSSSISSEPSLDFLHGGPLVRSKEEQKTMKRIVSTHALALTRTLLPGVAVAAGVAIVAGLLRLLPLLGNLSPLILALALGMLIRNFLGVPAWSRPGIVFCLRRVMRLAVALLGLQLSLQQLAGVGGLGLLIVALTLAGSYLFTVWLGATGDRPQALPSDRRGNLDLRRLGGAGRQHGH
jgi:uncharacterized RDD family membrane protein YckC